MRKCLEKNPLPHKKGVININHLTTPLEASNDDKRVKLKTVGQFNTCTCELELWEVVFTPNSLYTGLEKFSMQHFSKEIKIEPKRINDFNMQLSLENNIYEVMDGCEKIGTYDNRMAILRFNQPCLLGVKEWEYFWTYTRENDSKSPDQYACYPRRWREPRRKGFKL